MTTLNIFANQSGQIPLSQLDTNFATPITIGTTDIALGDTATTISGLILSGADLGTPTGNLANCTFPTLNQNTTGTASSVTGLVNVGNGGTGLTSLTSGYIPYGNGTGALSSSANLFFDGTNLGIGTSSPNSTLHLGSGGASIRIGITTSSQYGELYRDGPTGNIVLNAAQASFGNLVFQTSSSERMRIDSSSGNVGIGTTSAVIFGSERLTILGDAACLGMKTTGAQGCGLFMNSGSAGTANSGTFIAFYNNSAASNTGNITTTGTITAYTSVSDYRLKNNVLPMSGALNTIALLKPVTYNWVSDSSDGQGFIAHELAEVIPDCVSGEKDAVDADGNPQYQGIDTSFLVATLTAAIQELKAIIDTQQEQINSLLGK